MRSYYLKPTDILSIGNGGCRGGVGSNQPDGDYELEIGNDLNASSKMVALCVLHDEIIEFLEKSDSPIGHLIHLTYKQKIEEIENGLRERNKPKHKRTAPDEQTQEKLPLYAVEVEIPCDEEGVLAQPISQKDLISFFTSLSNCEPKPASFANSTILVSQNGREVEMPRIATLEYAPNWQRRCSQFDTMPCITELGLYTMDAICEDGQKIHINLWLTEKYQHKA